MVALLMWQSDAGDAASVADAATDAAVTVRRTAVRDVFRYRVLAPNLGHANVGGFTSFGESVVPTVEVFTLLEFVLE